MKAGVEAGHLGQIGRGGRDGADRRQIVRLVERGQRHELVEIVQHRLIDPLGRDVARAAVHDAMPDRAYSAGTQVCLEDADDLARGGAVVEAGGGPLLLAYLRAGGILENQARRHADGFNLTLAAPGPVPARCCAPQI